MSHQHASLPEVFALVHFSREKLLIQLTTKRSKLCQIDQTLSEIKVHTVGVAKDDKCDGTAMELSRPQNGLGAD